MPVYAAYLYDAVKVYIRALDEVLHDGQDARNGTAIMMRVLRRSYTSIQGFDVHINEDGDAEGNYSVFSLVRSSSGAQNWSLNVVGQFILDLPKSDALVSTNLASRNLLLARVVYTVSFRVRV